MTTGHGPGLTQPLLTTERLAASQQRDEEKAAKKAAREAAAQAKPDAISALLAQGDALLAPEAVARVKSQHEQWLVGLEQRMRNEEALLEQLRTLHKTYPQLKDRRWCDEDPEGRRLSKQVGDLHRALDGIYGATPTDPDYSIIRAMRSGSSYGDYADAIFLCVQDLSNGAPGILRRIDREEERYLRRQGVIDDYFFRLAGKTYYPNGFEGRQEVRRVVGFLFGARFRGLRSLEIERVRQPELLTRNPVGADIGLVVSRDVNYQLSGAVEFAVFVDGLVFPRPNQTATRDWRGVVHLRVEPSDHKGSPMKVFRIIEASGDIGRILEAGKRWGVFLKSNPKALVAGSHGVRTKMPDALLAYIERRADTPEALGLTAWQKHEDEWKKQKSGKRSGFGRRNDAPKADQGASEQPAVASAEAQAPAAEAPAEKPKRVRKPRAKKGEAKAKAGDNGATGPAELAPPATN